MSDSFFDTNIILYLLDDGQKADKAESMLQTGGVVSVQVLNETLVNCRRKAGMSWQEAGEFLCGVRELCLVQPLTLEVHQVGRALGEKYRFPVYDAMIVSAALIAGCKTLLSEDMHDGLVVEQSLTIRNPFSPLT